MIRLILGIYSFTKRHRLLASLAGVIMTAALVVSALSLSYEENIRDFLPFDDDMATAMEVYQDISGADRVYAVISVSRGDITDDDCTDRLMAGVDALTACVAKLDTAGYIKRVVAAVDERQIEDVTRSVYALMPSLLDEDEYDRIDSVLLKPGYVEERVSAIKESLQMPASGIVIDGMRHDPLGLFGSVTGRMAAQSGAEMFDTSDGYILSADGTDAFVMFESSFGPNESSLNGRLVDMLEKAASEAEAETGDIEISFTGAPVVAVANARCIKYDSIMGIVIAGVFIILLLVYVFRNVGNIVLIFVSVGWGWLFAVGTIALYTDSMSVIVVGISSVMLGIAVNYPLHMIDHLSESGDPKAALKQIVAPLVVGNVTTVGAFLCLVPLDSPALHDLGLFSSMLLIGTILFVLVFLPGMVRRRSPGWSGMYLLDRMASVEPSRNRKIVFVIVALTLMFGYFGRNVAFDPDLRNINYLTDRQKDLFDRLSGAFDRSGGDRKVYVVSTGETWDEATGRYEAAHSATSVYRQCVISSPGGMFVSSGTQTGRLDRWNALAANRDRLTGEIERAAEKYGFSRGAFSCFSEMLEREYDIAEEEDFDILTGTLYARNVSRRDGRVSIADILEIPDSVDKGAVIDDIRHRVPEGVIVFDIAGMNGAMTEMLVDDFNYIGLACSLIVFVFLWLSMGDIRLAIVAFIPMAVSWVWILGIMGLFDIHFNIVNVILATFIFGQGDDYTIFITEGLLYEYRTGQKVVSHYKRSIIVSALIMFAGIGVLVFADHPALRSLGQVAVIGMVTVVFMAYVLTPLAFDMLVKKRQKYRS